ncbi:DUF6213 family protein, partial [Streptomyces nigra]
MNREVTLPLIVDDRGTLQVAAADVSKLLRTVGGRWLHLVEAAPLSRSPARTASARASPSGAAKASAPRSFERT